MSATPEFKIERAERRQARLRLAITASSGGGKTWSSLLLAKGIVEHMLDAGVLKGTIDGKIGMVDTERKSGSLYSHLVPFDAINLGPPYTAERYGAALHTLEDAGYPVIIVDQISHAWSGPGGMLALLQKVARDSTYGNTFSAWGEVTPAQEEFIDSLLRSPAHLIVTMRQKTEWVIEDVVGRDGKTKKMPRRIGTKPVQRDGIEYEFTTLLGLDTDTHLARPIKNRCPVFADGVAVKLEESIGHSLAEWMLGGAPLAAEEAREPTPKERAVAITEAAERRIPQSPNAPDLIRVFDEAQQALRAIGKAHGAEIVARLLARVVTAKDRRKAEIGGQTPVVPASAAVTPDDVERLERLATDAGVPLLQVYEQFGVQRLATLAHEQYDGVVRWLIAAGQSKGIALEVPARVSREARAVPDAKAVLDRTVAAVGNARGGLFADMQDDIPF